MFTVEAKPANDDQEPTAVVWFCAGNKIKTALPKPHVNTELFGHLICTPSQMKRVDEFGRSLLPLVFPPVRPDTGIMTWFHYLIFLFFFFFQLTNSTFFFF